MTALPDLGRLLARKGDAAPAAERSFTLSDPARFATLRLPVRPAAKPARQAPAAAPKAIRIGVTLRLDPERHRRLRDAAQADGRSMQSLLLEAFDLHFTDSRPDAARRRLG